MIDGGPLGTSRLTGRQVAYRNESARYQPEDTPMEPTERRPRQEPQRRNPEPVQYDPATVKPRMNLAWVKWVVVFVVVALLAAGAWMFRPAQQSVASAIDAGKYQAVFLSNGQVYFGSLTIVNEDFMKLTNVFYLERQLTASTDTEAEDEINDQPVNGSDNNFQLLKYSDVLYGSEDAMVISSDDIIRFENLRPDGVVAKAIANRR